MNESLVASSACVGSTGSPACRTLTHSREEHSPFPGPSSRLAAGREDHVFRPFGTVLRRPKRLFPIPARILLFRAVLSHDRDDPSLSLHESAASRPRGIGKLPAALAPFE